MNKDIFGDRTTGRTGQWKFPLKDSGKQVEPRSMTGVTSRKCITGLNLLIKVIFAEEHDEKSLNPQHTRMKNEALETKWLALSNTHMHSHDVQATAA